jgi:hypothetical protein
MKPDELLKLLCDGLEKQGVGAEFALRLAQGMAPVLYPLVKQTGRRELAAQYVAFVHDNNALPHEVVDRAYQLADAFLGRDKRESENGKPTPTTP